MPGPPQTLPIEFSAVRTDTNPRDLPPGTLTLLRNVRIDEAGTLEKRTSYDRTATSSFSGGTLVGSITQLYAADTVLVKDTGSQIWARNGSTNYYRGLSRDVFPSWRQVGDGSNLSPARKPLTFNVGGDIWTFHLGVISTSSVASSVQLSVVDGTTGATKLASTYVTGTTSEVDLYAGCVDGSTVWLFLVTADNLTRILAYKFTSVTNSPTVTSFYVNAALSLTALDARTLPSGQIVVAGTSFIHSGGNYTFGDVRMFVDETTGLATGTVVETSTMAAGTTVPICNGVSIIDPDGGSRVAIAYYRTHASTANHVELVCKELNPTTLATTTTTSVHSAAGSGSGVNHVGVTGGYVNGSDIEIRGTVVPLELANSSSFPNVARDATVRHYRISSGFTGLVATMSDAWLASKPFKRGSEWFYLSGFSDGAANAQLSYWVRTSSDGAVHVPILDGEGGQIFHSAIRSTGGLAYTPRSGHITNVVAIDSNKYACSLLTEDVSANSPTPALVTLDFAATTFSSAPNILPGGIPKWVSSADPVAELAPLQYPYREITVSNGDDVSDLSVNRLCYLYATRNARGEIRRSQPSAVQQITFKEFLAGATDDWVYALAIPCLRHQAPGTDVWIELYGSVNAGSEMYLRARVKNDPTSASVTYNVRRPDLWGTGPASELLYTTGAPLRANSSLPSAKLAWFWKDRWWLGGIPGTSEVWFSQEKQAGRGPEFNPRLVLEWHGTGDVTAGGPITSDVSAIFRQDAIAIVSGVGPDGLGQGGNFAVQTVPGRDGCTNPASLVQHPAGGVLLFQRASDGRICALQGSTVVDISAGIEHLLPFTVTGAVHDSIRRQILFTLSSGTTLALDLAHPTADQPYGQWIEHTSAALTAAPAIGAQLVGGVPVFLESSNSAIATWSPGSAYNENGSAILKRWKLTRIAPAGFMGEFDLDHFWLSCTGPGNDSVYRYTFTGDWGTSVHDDAASDVSDVGSRASIFHTREVSLEVEETAGTGRGRQFDGLVLEIRPYGRIKQVKRKIA